MKRKSCFVGNSSLEFDAQLTAFRDLPGSLFLQCIFIRPGAAIFLVDVEEVFFVRWPQNLSQTKREKVKVGFAKDIEQGYVSFSVFMMHFHPAQVQQYFLQMLRKYFFYPGRRIYLRQQGRK